MLHFDTSSPTVRDGKNAHSYPNNISMSFNHLLPPSPPVPTLSSSGIMLCGTGGEPSVTDDTVATYISYPPISFAADEKRSLSSPSLSISALSISSRSEWFAIASTITHAETSIIDDIQTSPTQLHDTTDGLAKTEDVVGTTFIVLIILSTIILVGCGVRICFRRRLGLSPVKQTKHHEVKVPYSVIDEPPGSTVAGGLLSDFESTLGSSDHVDQIVHETQERHAIVVESIAGSESSSIQPIASQMSTAPNLPDEDPFADPVAASLPGPRPPGASTSNASYATTLPVYSEFMDPQISEETRITGSIDRPPSYESRLEGAEESG